MWGLAALGGSSGTSRCCLDGFARGTGATAGPRFPGLGRTAGMVDGFDDFGGTLGGSAAGVRLDDFVNLGRTTGTSKRAKSVVFGGSSGVSKGVKVDIFGGTLGPSADDRLDVFGGTLGASADDRLDVFGGTLGPSADDRLDVFGGTRGASADDRLDVFGGGAGGCLGGSMGSGLLNNVTVLVGICGGTNDADSSGVLGGSAGASNFTDSVGGDCGWENDFRGTMGGSCIFGATLESPACGGDKGALHLGWELEVNAS